MSDPLKNIFKNEKPIIGMIHLKPLPGSPMYDPTVMDFKKVLEIAVEEAKIMEAAGVDGVQVENIWDYPYLRGDKIGYETPAALAVAASKVIDSTVPAFAIFLACSYVKCPFLTIFFASFGSVTPGTSPFSILFSIA